MASDSLKERRFIFKVTEKVVRSSGGNCGKKPDGFGGFCHCKETYANQPIARRARASRIYFAIWTALVSETQAEFSETTPKYLRQKPKRAAAARPATIVVNIH
jgi:hypothetical protein